MRPRRPSRKAGRTAGLAGRTDLARFEVGGQQQAAADQPAAALLALHEIERLVEVAVGPEQHDVLDDTGIALLELAERDLARAIDRRVVMPHHVHEIRDRTEPLAQLRRRKREGGGAVVLLERIELM